MLKKENMMIGLKTKDQDIVALDQELNAMILNGQALEAFEKFYDETVVMQENDAAPTIGKDANRVREYAFMDAITEFRGAEVLSTGVNGHTTFSHWKYDFTHKEWGERNYRQVAVRTWKNGKIINEVFHYG